MGSTSGTVLPLGLPPAIPQWTGTPAAAAAKITLRWTKGTSYFRWSIVTAESKALQIVPGSPGVNIAAAPRYPSIPTVAWSSFERSARGEDADVAIQRIVGTTRHAEMKRTIHFANSQIKGNVYYQSYGTRLTYNYAGAQDSSGSVTFPSGKFGAATLGIEPGATTPKVIAGFSPTNDTSGNNCRVCHTASADGSVLITQKFGGSNGTSEMITSLTAATPSATTMTAKSDGTYAWPAIFPTGGFLFGNAGVQASYGAGPPPGGLDGSNAAITSSFWSLAAGTLGGAKSATYKTGGTSPSTITVPSASWSLEAGVPSFSSTGAKIAMQFYDGSVCPTGTLGTNCTAEEKKTGDKRSLAIMDFNTTTSQLSNFKVLNTEPAAACSTLHPSQSCFDVWPTFLPKDAGVVYEREVFHNGSVGGGLSDYGGTRSGCDGSGICSNDGTKGEIWWTNITGAASPMRMNAANGRTDAGVSYLPVGPDATSYCTASGFACAVNANCCSGTCNGGRCTGTGTVLLRPVGATCLSAAQCESNTCNATLKCGCTSNADCSGSSTCTVLLGICSGGSYDAVPAMTYVPGHNATVEPILNYEPTMNPTPTKGADGVADEYYWVVFTSRRMFGNIATGNPWWSDPRHHDLSKSVATKKLWVAAMKANPTPGTDPSFAAFYLPGQEWVSGNSKAYWVNQQCKAGSVSKTSSNLCDTTQDCCAGSTCRLDAPVTSPPTRHCITSGTCSNAGNSCVASSDCCSGFLCSNGTCEGVPGIPSYSASGVFRRDYKNPCPPAHYVSWGTFEYKGTFPAGTSMVVKARSAGKLGDGGAPDLSSTTPLVTIGTATATTTGWTFLPAPATTVDTLLKAAASTSSSSSSSSGTPATPAPDDATDAGTTDAALEAAASVPPPPSQCNPALSLGVPNKVVGGSALRFAGITRDELTIAWTAGGVLYVADRGTVTEPFLEPQAITTDASRQDGVALSSDGTYLVAIGANHHGFLAFERASRADVFASASATPFASLVDALDPAESIGDPVFINSEVVLLYSVYGKTPDTMRVAGRISVNASFFPSSTLVFDELRAQGSARRRPTGTGDDFQTIFYWDEVSQTEKIARLHGTEQILTVTDLGARPWMQTNDACDRVYFGSSDLSFATAR